MQPPQYQAPFTGNYKRTASAVQKLHNGGLEWPKPKRSVVLQCLAIDKTSGDSLRLESGGIRWDEPDNRWMGSAIDPVAKEIRVYGERVNADGTVMIQLPVDLHNNWPADITPRVSEVSWYMWELNFGTVCRTSRLTWSRHPNGPSGDLQKAFDDGAMLLARDDDELVKDGDPRLNDPVFNQQDDVPTYIEFIVTKAIRSVFPSQHRVRDVTIDFTDIRFNQIRIRQDLDLLIEARFANVKLVTSININNVPLVAEARPGLGIVLTREGLNGLTVTHEFGHTAGLEHRDDAAAIMRSPPLDGKEVNRSERAVLCAWNLERWDE